MNINFPAIMGVVNCTPDSFYTGARTTDPDRALDRIGKMIREGADMVDIGACSTRPGAAWPSESQEWERLEPVLKKAKELFPQTIFSIDTFRPSIVEKAYSILGKFWVNDIFAGSYDKAMLPLISSLKLPWIAMHQEPYEGPEGIARFFLKVSHTAAMHEIKEFFLDPGFGFNKDVDQNFQVMESLPSLVPRNEKGEPVAPLLVGISRKRMTYLPLDITPDEALISTSALHLHLLFKGASILRVHDVLQARQMVTLYKKMSIFAN
ncbi:MAG: Dihydropteroate synthase [Bacteroidetes bacterium ADurb.Bin037]|nr:MAG: Dihydropteroate synthase [Bacteroidetes bacterium ADurb.Bin037]HPW78848.1 dihydropteroate synthase [Bacteroidales bacterium]HQB55574.1 dihydropteroate synthase [Bacteroidales bacterium]